MTGLQAILMIPAAIVVALVSALTAYRSELGTAAAAGYFVGTAVGMGLAFLVSVALIFTIYCGDDGSC